MDPVARWSTCPVCSGVLDLVLFGHIAARKGVAMLNFYRRNKSIDEGCAVAALRFLAHCPDPRVARAARVALHDLFNEDMWKLWTSYVEAAEQTKAKYYEITPGIRPPEPMPPPPPARDPVIGTSSILPTSAPTATSDSAESF